MTPKRNRADGPKNADPARRRASADPNVLRAALLPRQSTGQDMPRQPWADPRSAATRCNNRSRPEVRTYCVRQPNCFSDGDNSVHRLVMYACSLASKVPPRSISAASALSRKYGCVDEVTQEIRTPEDPTVTSKSESSHSSHSKVPLSRTWPMCGHWWPDSIESLTRCVLSPIRVSSLSLIWFSDGLLLSN